MQPSWWIREPKFRKTRRRLSHWTALDLERFAMHLFGTADLDGQQLNDLIAELRKPGCQPPGGLEAKDPVVIMVDNPEDYAGTHNRIYLSGDRVKIQFRDHRAAMGWAHKLITRTNVPWEKALTRWQEGMRLQVFCEVWAQKRSLSRLLGLQEFQLDRQLEKTLKQITQRWRRLTTPYPDKTPLDRQFFSLSRGDKLQDPEGRAWEIAERHPQLEGPPRLVLRPIPPEPETPDAV